MFTLHGAMISLTVAYGMKCTFASNPVQGCRARCSPGAASVWMCECSADCSRVERPAGRRNGLCSGSGDGAVGRRPRNTRTLFGDSGRLSCREGEGRGPGSACGGGARLRGREGRGPRSDHPELLVVRGCDLALRCNRPFNKPVSLLLNNRATSLRGTPCA